MDEDQLKIIQERREPEGSEGSDTHTCGRWVDPAPLSVSALSSSCKKDRPTSFSNALQRYRSMLPPTSSAGTPRLTFVRYLHGPKSDVEKIWVADGCCQSMAVFGLGPRRGPQGIRGSKESMWLEGAQVEIGDDASWKGRSSVIFDERGIATAQGGRAELRQFDVQTVHLFQQWG